MTTVEIVLMIVAYTLLVVTIFLQIICYNRNLETRETIAFTFSLLLLIVALTSSPLLDEAASLSATNVFSLLAMILVALFTPLNIFTERQYEVSAFWKNLLFAFSAFLFLTTLAAHFLHLLIYWQYVVISFLGLSVVCSMLFIRATQPAKRIMHREKTERRFAIAFIVLVPLSLVLTYMVESDSTPLTIGFTIPLVFILLAGSKFLDDLQRLSLLHPAVEPREQHFKNYALSDREREIATLLARGRTYKQIGEELFISIPTVKTHATNIYRKFGVKNRNELTTLLIS